MAAKPKPDIPADMWLHVATDALARYAAGGGQVEFVPDCDDDPPALVIALPGVTASDERLAPAFHDLMTRTAVLVKEAR